MQFVQARQTSHQTIAFEVQQERASVNRQVEGHERQESLLVVLERRAKSSTGGGTGSMIAARANGSPMHDPCVAESDRSVVGPKPVI
jgi:hypothetical protein